MTIASTGQAMWNQREALAEMAPRLRELIAAVGRPTDLYLFQWAQIIAFTLEFRPDLILELGRGYGNSTCCFLESARRLEEGGSPCRLVSLCLDNTWGNQTVGRLEGICDASWFARGRVLCGDILDYDPADLEKASRVLVFWDAHGTTVADWVLSGLMPQLAGRPHAILMHDIGDAVHDFRADKSYGNAHLWDGECATTNFFRVGNIVSSVTQAILALDFTGRNDIALHSAAEGIQQHMKQHPEQLAELRRLLGDDMAKLNSGWFWFSLNEAAGRLTFPRPRPRTQPAPPPSPSLPRRALRLGRRLAGMIKRKMLRAG